MKDFIKLLKLGITERGNTALRNYESGSCVFWHSIVPGLWLEISMSPENYPAWEVNIHKTTVAKLRTHIEENLGDPWYFQKNAIGANALPDGYNTDMPINKEYVLEDIDDHLHNENPDYATNDTLTVIHEYLEEKNWTLSVEEIEKIRKDFDE